MQHLSCIIFWTFMSLRSFCSSTCFCIVLVRQLLLIIFCTGHFLQHPLHVNKSWPISREGFYVTSYLNSICRVVTGQALLHGPWSQPGRVALQDSLSFHFTTEVKSTTELNPTTQLNSTLTSVRRLNSARPFNSSRDARIYKYRKAVY